MLERIGDFSTFLGQPADGHAYDRLRQSETTGRPLGSDEWIAILERDTSRILAPRKRGRKAEGL